VNPVVGVRLPRDNPRLSSEAWLGQLLFNLYSSTAMGHFIFISSTAMVLSLFTVPTTSTLVGLRFTVFSLQSVFYDAFFKSERGMTEVGCWMHARRYFFKALESDEPHMGPAMHLIARLYAVEERAKTLSLSAQQRLVLRQRVSARLLGKLHQYLLELQPEVLPKSPSGAAVRYALNQWEALTRFLEDGELEIDNGATERANRDIALGRGNWTFFGSDGGGKTAACCEASSLPASGAASSRLPGSTMCSRASRRTLSPGSVNCFPTTGSRFPQPKLKQAADTTNRGLSPVAVYETLTNRRGGGDSCR
jgi:hypothetical protein